MLPESGKGDNYYDNGRGREGRPSALRATAPTNGVFGYAFFEKVRQAETFMKLNCIPSHFVALHFFGGYEISKWLPQ